MTSLRRVCLMVAAVVAASVCLTNVSAAPAKLPSDPASWTDKRIAEDERPALHAALGFAPPELKDDTTWIGDGAAASFQELRGKVVVIQSWTHTNERGRGAIQRTATVLKNQLGDDVKLVLLHTPDDAENVASYLERRKTPAPVLVDRSGRLCDDLGIYTDPVTVLIDRNGAVRASGVSISLLPEAVDLLKAEPFDASAKAPEVVKPRDERDPVPAGGAAKASDKPKAQFPPITGAVKANDLRGKKAPEIRVGEWIANEPKLDGKVVMVEFWATWCGPCKKSIPHLGELQKKYPNELAVIGISNEDAGTIRGFMKHTKMEYSVASDTQNQVMSVVRSPGIPHAFVMSPDGIVRWQGHPASLSEETLQQIIAASDIKTTLSRPKRWRVPAEETPKAS